MKDEFTKRWDKDYGFTEAEALAKADKVNEAYKVRQPDSRWNPAQIELDHTKKSGYKVTISRK